MALTDKLFAIGDAIREKTGETDLLTLDAIPTAIQSISGGGGGYTPTDDELTFSGDCSYAFYNGKWDWVLKNYGNRIKTKDITNLQRMFFHSYVTTVPFTLNIKSTSNSTLQIGELYKYSQITKPPMITGGYGTINSLNSIFESSSVKEIPDNYFDFIDNFQSIYSYSQADYIFAYCKYLTDIPTSFNKIIDKMKNRNSAYNTPYSYCFYECYKLRKIENLSALDIINKNTNMFTSTFNSCFSLRKITFKSNQVKSWSKQVMDLSTVGYGFLTQYIEKEYTLHKVDTDEDYQNYKQYDDWWSSKVEYACYNKTSAVETINSLPDTSAYLATTGGTNTIKFKGEAGSATDGGAINTMTEEEIAVATAKGWTLSFV